MKLGHKSALFRATSERPPCWCTKVVNQRWLHIKYNQISSEKDLNNFITQYTICLDQCYVFCYVY